MSTVYEGVHRNGRRVAIKVLHTNLAADSGGRKRFLRESHLANRAKHPGVVAVLDDDATPDGTWFLVMELLEGETLHQRWERLGRVLPVPEVLAIVAEILDTLAAVHAVGIVHRDLKPSNVFLTSSGIKLLDFGVAHLREKSTEETVITRSGSMLGTPAFMAPEQARGHWAQVDATTDLWAVGAIMFTLLAGRLVHDGSSAQELLISAATQAPVSLRNFAPLLPETVVAVVDKALRLEKGNRWPDATAMLAEVRALAGAHGAPQGSGDFFANSIPVTEPVPDTAAPSAYVQRKPGLRPVFFWGVLPAAVAVAGAFMKYQNAPQRDAGPVPPAQLMTSEQPKADAPRGSQAETSELSPPAPMEMVRVASPLEQASGAVSSGAATRKGSGRSRIGRPAVSTSIPVPSPETKQAEGASSDSAPERALRPIPSETFSGIAVDSETLNQRQ
jgi:serine/threonine-protein kinase